MPTAVYVNEININKLKLCIQNQKPWMININTIHRKVTVEKYLHQVLELFK